MRGSVGGVALTEEPLQQPNVEQDELRLNSQAIKRVEINQLQYRRPTEEEQVAPSAAGSRGHLFSHAHLGGCALKLHPTSCSTRS